MKNIFANDPRVRMVNGIPIMEEFAPKGSFLDAAYSPAMDAAIAGRSTTAAPVPLAAGAIDAAGSPAMKAALASTSGTVDAAFSPDSPLPPPAAASGTSPTGANPSDFVKPTEAQTGVVPMGTTTETQTTSKRYDKKAIAALDKANLAQGDAIDAAAKVGQQRAAEEAGYIHQRNAELAAIEDQHAREAASQKIEQDYQQQRAREAQETVAMKAKADPDRWKVKGVGAQIAAALGTALGAFGASLNGGPNTALEILNGAMDREIRAMEREFDQAKDVATLENNMFAEVRRAGMDANEAYHAVKRGLYEKAGANLDLLAAKYKSPEIQANAQQTKAALMAAAAEADAKRSEATVQRSTVTKPLTGAAGMGQQLPAGEAAKLGEATGAVQNAESLYKQWDKDAKGPIGWLASFLPATDASRYENNMNAAAQVIGGYLEGGKLTETDLARYKKMLPQPGELEETAKRKRDAITNLVATRQASQKQALAGSGYNVAGIKDAKPQLQTFKPR